MNEKITAALPKSGCLLGFPQLPNGLPRMEQIPGDFTKCVADCCGRKVFILPHQVDMKFTHEMPVVCYCCAADDKTLVVYRGGILGLRDSVHPLTGKDHGPPVDLAAMGATNG